MRGNLLFIAFFRGSWDEALEGCRPLHRRVRGVPPLPGSRLRGRCGRTCGSRAAIAPARSTTWTGPWLSRREIKDPQVLLPSLLQSARGYALLGRDEEARALALEALDARSSSPRAGGYARPAQRRCAERSGFASDVQELIERAPENPWRERPLLPVPKVTSSAAADSRTPTGGLPALEAEDRFSAAEELIATGRRAEGEAELEQGARLLPIGRRDVLHPARRGAARTGGDRMSEPRQERKVVTVVFCDLVGFTRAGGDAGPRGRGSDSPPVPRPRPNRARALRRHRREVHR